ncbi:FGGY-family carbohydrate kinase [Actibacterium lipolyticum]|uniref:Ribulokinase n=1 Tax=Actibacterium lipolyticum TaxID=1524263 RepID=A0A238JVM6_9RHOB|nr:FGGY-family carbohydrate kinase [Actibacterium lipolyticum]SMX34700.1 Ribulokinase [Actibacterium lipolyticum]
MGQLICAVDVGTASARAGVFTAEGQLVSRAVHPILISQNGDNEAEHDSNDIWQAVCRVVRGACDEAGVDKQQIGALALDGTCSLVLVGQGRSVSLSAPGFDTISWFDHRAVSEAEVCTKTGHSVLEHIGGTMSPEMQCPKLLWVKRKRPDIWENLGGAYDLADYLTWRATGQNDRSQCTLTAKWTYLAHAGGWQRDFLSAIGMEDLLEKAALPETARPVGSAIGRLTATAAKELGLTQDCVVGTGTIDAFAGGIGVLGKCTPEERDGSLAMIAGTSSCVMGFAPESRKIAGIWGPYLGAILPGVWVNEGGQSATGALLDFVLNSFGEVVGSAAHEKVLAHLAELLEEHGPGFARDLNILPDFNGNRSPFADPTARGVISGLTLDTSFEAQCRVYWRAAVGLGLGTRQILARLAEGGYSPKRLHIAGGHAKSQLLTQLYADATGCIVEVSSAPDAVLLGAAMIGATAAGIHPSLEQAAAAMAQETTIRFPRPEHQLVHEKDFAVFEKMQAQRAELNALIEE